MTFFFLKYGKHSDTIGKMTISSPSRAMKLGRPDRLNKYETCIGTGNYGFRLKKLRYFKRKL